MPKQTHFSLSQPQWMLRLQRAAVLLLLLVGLVLVDSPIYVPAAHAYGPAQGFGPNQYPSTLPYGQGVYFAPYQTTVYEQPEESAPVVETLAWASNNTSLMVNSQERQGPVPAKSVFLAFYPSLNIALLPVLGENGNGWAEVVYDLGRNKTGWVQLSATGKRPLSESTSTPEHFGQYQTWLEFMKLNATRNGIYWLGGVSNYHQSPRTAPEDKAKMLNLMVNKGMRVRHVRGNWLLVEVRDMGGQMPMGWIRWRDEEGHLMVFANFARVHQGAFPALPAGY
ncbi:MAG: hypothetical protein SFZ03_01265 [Candidatus Melainabacteria bacterium]|nr:hypothetical protein [Candidatus Melainabacteria bacterium]